MIINQSIKKKRTDQLNEKTQVFITNTMTKNNQVFVASHTQSCHIHSLSHSIKHHILILSSENSHTLLFDRLSFCPWSQSHQHHAPCCPTSETEPGTLQACHCLQFHGYNSSGLKQSCCPTTEGKLKNCIHVYYSITTTIYTFHNAH